MISFGSGLVNVKFDYNGKKAGTYINPDSIKNFGYNQEKKSVDINFTDKTQISLPINMEKFAEAFTEAQETSSVVDCIA